MRRRLSPFLKFMFYVKITVGEPSTAVPRVSGSIPALNKYLYDLLLVVPGLGVCRREFKCL